jgi:hypothetical protein
MTCPGVNVAPFFGGILGVSLIALFACDGKEYCADHGTTTSDEPGYHLYIRLFPQLIT